MHPQDNLTDKQKLRHCVKTSIKTTMIGALAAVEEHLGYLWGIDLDFEHMTPEQKKIRAHWLDARDRIMKVGENAQNIASRAVNSHCVKKKFYHKEF